MRANSTTGDFAKSANRQYLEGYNATRGVYRGTGALVAPNTPVRFIDGEKTEDWISANSKALLGWDDPARGKGPGRNPGYTVYILNTWDSAEARAILKPQNEYHVWKINRTDPDTGQFDGIDWARIWGGRYRFMMVDAGAAPNPYEAETLGQPQPLRLRLGELRAAALGVPRERAAAGHARQHRRGRRAGGHAGRDLGREPAELHARPHRERGRPRSGSSTRTSTSRSPATGQYWFSDNVWHDAKAELPWASDLNKLYNQERRPRRPADADAVPHLRR